MTRKCDKSLSDNKAGVMAGEARLAPLPYAGPSLAWPEPSTRAAIDGVDRKKNNIHGVANDSHGHCTP